MTSRPSADHRAFYLARAIVMEVNMNCVDVNSNIFTTLQRQDSPLNDYWKVRLKAKLRGEPMWIDDEKVLDRSQEEDNG